MKGTAMWVSVIGSCVLVWGLTIVKDGSLRSMTARLGFLAPIPVLVTYTGSKYIYLKPIDWAWTPPETVWHALGDAFHWGPFLGLFLFPVGIALARRERQWVLRGLGLVAGVTLLGIVVLKIPGPYHLYNVLGAFIGYLFGAFFFGTPAFVIGLLSAKPSLTDSGQSNWILSSFRR